MNIASNNSEIDLARIMAEQAEIRMTGFAALERSEVESENDLDGNQNAYVNAEIADTEISYDDEEIEALKREMKEAKQTWEKRDAEIKKTQKEFRFIFSTKHDLDLIETEKELRALATTYYEARERYEKIAKIGANADNTANITLDDVEVLSDSEAREMKSGVAKRAVDDIEISLTKEGRVATEETKDFIEKVKKDCQGLLDKSLVAFEKYPQLRDVSKSNYDNAVHLLKTEVVDSIILKDLQGDFERVFIGIWKDLIDVKNLQDQAVLDMEADEYIVINGHKKAVKIYDALESKMTKEQADLEKIGPRPSESVIAWTQRLTKFILKNALNNSLN